MSPAYIVTAHLNVTFSNSRCLANLRPLLDSGTMGTKGHTEVIVPHLTESYNSHVSELTFLNKCLSSLYLVMFISHFFSSLVGRFDLAFLICWSVCQ